RRLREKLRPISQLPSPESLNLAMNARNLDEFQASAAFDDQSVLPIATRRATIYSAGAEGRLSLRSAINQAVTALGAPRPRGAAHCFPCFVRGLRKPTPATEQLDQYGRT